MKTISITLFVAGSLALAVAARGQQVLAEYDWQRLADTGQLLGGVAVSVDGKNAVRIVNTNDTPLQMQLLKIQRPPITQSAYALSGEIKYENVRGGGAVQRQPGFLEMWNIFPPARPGMMEGRYFSRTLGNSGDMGMIVGTSNWRRFVLPFDRSGTTNSPVRLELNLHLPGPGTVWLGPLKLVEYTGGLSAALTPPNAWWSDRSAGLVGGIGGGLLGTLAGLLAWLASKGRARHFVLVSMLVLIGLGAASLVAGIVALSSRQPYGVWFCLLLFGVLLLSILPVRLRQFRRQYDELELRRMAAVDAMHG